MRLFYQLIKAGPITGFTILGVMTLLIATYLLGIKKTLNSYKTYNRLEQQIHNNEKPTETIPDLQKQIEQLDARIGHTDSTVEQRRRQLLSDLTSIGHDFPFVLTEIPPDLCYPHNDFDIYYSSFTLTGTYSNLLNVLNKIENHNSPGQVVSCHFFLKRNPITKKKELNLKIIFKHLRSKV